MTNLPICSRPPAAPDNPFVTTKVKKKTEAVGSLLASKETIEPGSSTICVIPDMIPAASVAMMKPCMNRKAKL